MTEELKLIRRRESQRTVSKIISLLGLDNYITATIKLLKLETVLDGNLVELNRQRHMLEQINNGKFSWGRYLAYNSGETAGGIIKRELKISYRVKLTTNDIKKFLYSRYKEAFYKEYKEEIVEYNEARKNFKQSMTKRNAEIFAEKQKVLEEADLNFRKNFTVEYV